MQRFGRIENGRSVELVGDAVHELSGAPWLPGAVRTEPPTETEALTALAAPTPAPTA